MDVPDLARIVETHVSVPSLEPATYFDLLRRDVSPYLRELSASGSITWFSFLLHTPQQLLPAQPGQGYIVHLRLAPAAHLDSSGLIESLPPHFQNPHVVPPLAAISGLDASALRDSDWAYAWKAFGEASEWVLDLLDAYATGPQPAEILQFLHFMTNPLMLGQQSVHGPTQVRF